MQEVLRIDGLPANALDAAAAFHANWLGKARSLLDGGADSLVLVMAPAAHDHADWRRAAVRDLARAHAPKRVNLLASDDETAIAAALDYLAHAPGLTGQFLPLDGHGAGNPAG
ncbi:MAG: hypothetical protein R3E18_02935 [Sphingomonadaceae bacterium]|nr:hypothetical protein [Sphingomonadaceae bacterium]